MTVLQEWHFEGALALFSLRWLPGCWLLKQLLITAWRGRGWNIGVGHVKMPQGSTFLPVITWFSGVNALWIAASVVLFLVFKKLIMLTVETVFCSPLSAIFTNITPPLLKSVPMPVADLYVCLTLNESEFHYFLFISSIIYVYALVLSPILPPLSKRLTSALLYQSRNHVHFLFLTKMHIIYIYSFDKGS